MAEIIPIIKRKATLYTDGFKSYDGLVKMGYKKHFRVKHSGHEFAKGRNHINGIESFWSFCKVRLTRRKGVHKNKFYYHLKECELRYNYRKKIPIYIFVKLLKTTTLNCLEPYFFNLFF